MYIVCSLAYSSYDELVNLISSLHSLGFRPFIRVTVQWTRIFSLQRMNRWNEPKWDRFIPTRAADEFHSSTLEEYPRLMETNAFEQKSPCRSTRLPVISSDINLGIDDVFSLGAIYISTFFPRHDLLSKVLFFQGCFRIKVVYLSGPKYSTNEAPESVVNVEDILFVLDHTPSAKSRCYTISDIDQEYICEYLFKRRTLDGGCYRKISVWVRGYSLDRFDRKYPITEELVAVKQELSVFGRTRAVSYSSLV